MRKAIAKFKMLGSRFGWKYEKTNKTNAKIYEGAVIIGIIEYSIKKT